MSFDLIEEAGPESHLLQLNLFKTNRMIIVAMLSFALSKTFLK